MTCCAPTPTGSSVSERVAELHDFPDVVLEGELVVLDESGRPMFEQVRGRSMTTTRNSVMRAAATQPAALFAFDILWLDGRHMRDRPLIERKATLQRTIPPARRIMYLTHVEEHRRGLYEQVSQLSVQR